MAWVFKTPRVRRQAAVSAPELRSTRRPIDSSFEASLGATMFVAASALSLTIPAARRFTKASVADARFRTDARVQRSIHCETSLASFESLHFLARGNDVPVPVRTRHRFGDDVVHREVFGGTAVDALPIVSREHEPSQVRPPQRPALVVGSPDVGMKHLVRIECAHFDRGSDGSAHCLKVWQDNLYPPARALHAVANARRESALAPGAVLEP